MHMSGEEMIDSEGSQDPSKVPSTGLNPDVQNLHEEFHNLNQHLAEVRELHTKHLVTAGMIPETHIAKTNPERTLDWLVAELNAVKNPDGLTIPMKGVKQQDLTVTETSDENQKFVQISISSETIGEFSRKIPLPEATSDWSVKFVDGNLRLRW